MVLSNKKLKQKLRAAVAESLVAAEEARNGRINPDPPKPDPKSKTQQHSLKSATEKPRLSKREKRRKTLSLRGPEDVKTSGGGGVDLERGSEEGGSEIVGEKKRKLKRKREERLESGGLESAESVVAKKSEKNKKKKKKNRNKNKKEKEKTEDEEVKGDEKRANGGIEQGLSETIMANDSQETAEVATKIYVGGIPYYSTEDDIRSYFEGCGTITEVDCMKFPESGKFRGIAIIHFKALHNPFQVHIGAWPAKILHSFNSHSDLFLMHLDIGWKLCIYSLMSSRRLDYAPAYLLQTEAAAKRGLALDGSDMGGLFLKIQPFKSTRAKNASNFAPAIVEGYNRIYVGNLSWDITEDELRKLFSGCSISAIRFGEDKETGEFRGYAHVDFTDSLSLNMALKLDQNVLCGRPVRIRCAVPKRKATESNTNSLPEETKEAENGGGASTTVSGKIRRRTCYECGEKGHLSSDCPKKQAADLTISSVT
ncbi:phragmoplastin interacting protein 1 [Actinidia rufa]|uniref:Phragmoplastin interacting protein 1 n=1 Tax=Actinidia rufa TaxID=165716 RepID=A0A7J0GVK5_9ERIC|nr:phragmoplastin interacting protein 1 [Actinidia rufa]